LGGLTASATGYYSYIYNNEDKAVEAPTAAEPYSSFRGSEVGIGDFDSPQDLFVDSNGYIYIADTKNNRIVILDDKNSLVKSIDSFVNAGVTDTFSAPCGICVSKDGSIYIADTDNARIVKLDFNGTLEMIINSPNDETLPDDFYFKPTKIAVDKYNKIFVISDGYNIGLMEFDVSGEYLKSIGAPKVAISLIDQLWKSISTKEQQKRTQSYVPTEYSNVSVDADGFLYVTTSSYESWQYLSGQIKPLRKLNSKGTDVFNRIGDPVGDSSDGGLTYTGPSSIVDFCEIGNGNFAILDQNRGRIFAYNSEGELLYEFGGPGNYNGGLNSPSALAYRNGIFYVLDSDKARVCMYQLTEYGQLFHDIAKARNEINFGTEEALWNDVIQKNANCALAIRGLGNAAYKEQNMKQAMYYFKLAGDKENYSKAYAFVRREWIENNAGYLLLIIISVVFILIFAPKIMKKLFADPKKHRYLSSLHYSSHIMFHPLDGFWDLKREKRGSIAAAVTLLGMTIVVMILSSLFIGFIFNNNNLKTYNMFGNIVLVLVAVALWCISQWCVTSLMDGEGKLKDIFIATCYSLTPYIILNIIGILLSNVLLSNEGDLYYVLISLAVVWMVLLLIASFMQTHNYFLSKTLLAILITFVVILLIIFIGMLVFALMQQLVAFVKDIYDEVTLRM